MHTLSVVAPQDLYRFARDEGLLAHPGAPEPTRTTHPIAATTVVAHDDTITLLPAMALDTVSNFKILIPNATVLGSNLGVVFGNYLVPGGFYHQGIWAIDGQGNSNLTSVRVKSMRKRLAQRQGWFVWKKAVSHDPAHEIDGKVGR